MDHDSFDALARTLATSGSRRRFLAGLVGALAGVGVGRVDAAQRAPRQANGLACTRATDCASLKCVDGVCCDRACTGQCEACNSAGACTFVTGDPVGGRPACGGAGTICAGTCSGTQATCGYSIGGDCGEKVCDHTANASMTHTCAADGACVANARPCGLYRCAESDGSCYTSCTHDGICVDGATCNDFDQCVAPACSPDQRLCRGECIPGLACCDDGDCGFDAVCLRAACNRTTHTCEVVNAESDPRCVGDACYTRACVNGVCQQNKTFSVVGVCNEEVCDPQVGWLNGPPKVCNSPGPCQVGPGVCDPARFGCVYESACADCQTCIGGQCVDDCPPAAPGSCFNNGACNPESGICEYEDTCGCAFCDPSLTCRPYPDGTITDAGGTCCDGAEFNFPCRPGACPDWREIPGGLTVCCGEWYGNSQCCESPNIVLDGTTKCCPPGTVDVCTGLFVSTYCDHPCNCTLDGCVCS